MKTTIKAPKLPNDPQNRMSKVSEVTACRISGSKLGTHGPAGVRSRSLEIGGRKASFADEPELGKIL
jgi:hypothetical protein